jgi:hypothetical protein
MTATNITDRFVYKRPSPSGIARIEVIRAACAHLAELIQEHCPPCRETSLAITKLEEVSMWSNKGIVFNDNTAVDNG